MQTDALVDTSATGTSHQAPPTALDAALGAAGFALGLFDGLPDVVFFAKDIEGRLEGLPDPVGGFEEHDRAAVGPAESGASQEGGAVDGPDQEGEEELRIAPESPR